MKQATGVLLAGILMLSSSLTAVATPINGAVVLTGEFSSVGTGDGFDWTNATQFHAFDLLWSGATGDYTGFAFSPANELNVYRSDDHIAQFWSTGNGSENASFDITSIAFTITSNSFLAQGTGIAYLSGFDPTIATWQITASPTAFYPLYFQRASFIASGVPVSDDVTTAGALCIALVALFWLRPRPIAR